MNDSVQRPLAVTTPLARGEDIGALQHAINRRLDARGSDYRVDEDHVFGPDTMDTGQIVAYILGVGTDKQDDLLSEYEQELVATRTSATRRNSSAPAPGASSSTTS